MSSPTIVSTFTDSLGELKDNLLPVAAVGLGVGATVLALKKGWSLVKKFTS